MMAEDVIASAFLNIDKLDLDLEKIILSFERTIANNAMKIKFL